MDNLGSLLESVLKHFPPVNSLRSDPISFTRKLFEEKRNKLEIESLALFSAMLSYGSAKQFMQKIAQVLELSSNNFLDLIQKRVPYNQPLTFPNYRLSTAKDIEVVLYALGALTKKHKDIESIFLEGYLPEQSIKQGLIVLREALYKEVIAIQPPTRGLMHLLPDPSKGGCVKRWHMFLRWMVRKDDGVDMGLWTKVSPAFLLIPLDTHISRIARNLGLTNSKADSWNTAQEITDALRKFSSDDPVRYDFALCHLGISGQCTHGRTKEPCTKCLLASSCRHNKQL